MVDEMMVNETDRVYEMMVDVTDSDEIVDVLKYISPSHHLIYHLITIA